MKQYTSTAVTGQAPAARRKTTVPELVITVPPRGGEPKSIGHLMEPVQAIMKHPDRNRIMAEFFKRYW